MYDPTVGRFITLDPIGFDGADTNQYRYVGNSPTNATDPRGLRELLLDLSQFTDEQLRTALEVSRKHVKIATAVVATGKPPWNFGGRFGGSPTAGGIESGLECV